jgi:hypothetical protein
VADEDAIGQMAPLAVQETAHKYFFYVNNQNPLPTSPSKLFHFQPIPVL